MDHCNNDPEAKATLGARLIELLHGSAGTVCAHARFEILIGLAIAELKADKYRSTGDATISEAEWQILSNLAAKGTLELGHEDLMEWRGRSN